MYHDYGQNFFVPRGIEIELDSSGDRKVVRMQWHDLKLGLELVREMRWELNRLEMDITEEARRLESLNLEAIKRARTT
jgi:hypothetical protein